MGQALLPVNPVLSLTPGRADGGPQKECILVSLAAGRRKRICMTPYGSSQAADYEKLKR